jgi:hypothetical protein
VDYGDQRGKNKEADGYNIGRKKEADSFTGSYFAWFDSSGCSPRHLFETALILLE